MLYYSYLLTLKDKIEKDGARAVDFNTIVNVIWSLIVTEDDHLQNPIIAKLYERLFEFKRNDKALTREELLELYQVSIYA